MKLSTFTLLTSLMVSVSAIASFAASDNEPIPDFGSQGLIGFERANPVSGAALSGPQPKRTLVNVLTKDPKEKFNQIQEEMRDRAKRRART
jgi:hypothetical protein